MDYIKRGNVIMARIDRGDRIAESIEKIAVVEQISTAFVSGIGAADHLEIGCYEISTKEYRQYIHDGDFEITSLLGNITTKDDKFYLHLHINATDEKGNCFGGHFNEGVISGTCELQIQIIDADVERELDEETGINIWKF